MPTSYINSNDVAGATSGLLNLVRMITGKDKITGGPTIDANGNVTVQPYQGSSGFLGRASRDRAQAANNQLLSGVYDRQLAGKNQLDVENLRAQVELARQLLSNSGQLNVAKEQNTGRLKEVKVAAKQNRKNEKLRSSNTQEEEKLKAALEVLKKLGLTPSSQNAYETKVSPQLIENFGAKAKLEGNALNSPNIQDSVNAGINAEYRKPQFDNINKGTVSVPANSVAFIPDDQGKPSYTVEGPSLSQNITNYGGYTDPETKQVFGEKAITVNSYAPPGIKNIAVPQHILNNASKIGSNPSTAFSSTPITAAPVSPFGNSTIKPISVQSKNTSKEQANAGEILLKVLKMIEASNDPSLKTFNRVTDLPF